MISADEKFVRDNWDSPRFDWSYQYGDPSKPKYWLFYIGDWLAISGYDTRKKIVASAAEFTRNRLEDIRQLEEEIKTMEIGRDDWLSGFYDLPLPTAWTGDCGVEIVQLICQISRILAREQAALAELKRGMK